MEGIASIRVPFKLNLEKFCIKLFSRILLARNKHTVAHILENKYEVAEKIENEVQKDNNKIQHYQFLSSKMCLCNSLNEHTVYISLAGKNSGNTECLKFVH